MALIPLYCGGCGLEIEPYEEARVYRETVYHGFPYPCNPDPSKEESDL